MPCWAKDASYYASSLEQEIKDIERELERIEKEIGHEALSRMKKSDVLRMLYKRLRKNRLIATATG